MHHTSDYRQHCHVGNTAQHCRWGPFQDSDFAGDPEDSKSTSGGILCIFGSRFICSCLDVQETNVSVPKLYRTETISLDAGLRMDGLLAFD